MFRNPLLSSFLFSPPDNRILFLSKDQTLALLDLISTVIRKEIINTSEIKDYEVPLFRPFHLIAGEGENHIHFGISNKNAVRNMTNLSVARVLVEPKELKEISRAGLGVELDYVISLNKEIVNANSDFLSLYADAAKKDFNVQIRTTLPIPLIDEIEKEVVLLKEETFRRRDKMFINPIFKTKDITIDNSLCFALLPFDSDRLEIFNDIIEPLVKDTHHMQILKANDIFSTNEIMEDIWNYICKAKFIIADISKKNPNVFYELGIAHTVGKEVIAICEEGSFNVDYDGKFPFDIAHRRIIIYKNTGPGMKRFEEELSSTIKNLVSQKSEQVK